MLRQDRQGRPPRGKRRNLQRRTAARWHPLTMDQILADLTPAAPRFQAKKLPKIRIRDPSHSDLKMDKGLLLVNPLRMIYTSLLFHPFSNLLPSITSTPSSII